MTDLDFPAEFERVNQLLRNFPLSNLRGGGNYLSIYLENLGRFPDGLKIVKREDPNLQQSTDFYHCVADRTLYISNYFIESIEIFVSEKLTELLSHEPSVDDVTFSVRTTFHILILHELCHLAQGLTSQRYKDIRDAPQSIRTIDYHADAVSILACFDLYRESNLLVFPTFFAQHAWNDVLAVLICHAIWGMAAFDFRSVQEKKQMSRARFRRYATWYFQVARARKIKHFSSIDDFAILKEVVVDFGFPVSGVSYVEPDSFRSPQVSAIANTGAGLPQKTFMYVAIQDETSISRLYRLDPKVPEKIHDFVQGIFGHVEIKTRGILDELFDTHRDFHSEVQRPLLGGDVVIVLNERGLVERPEELSALVAEARYRRSQNGIKSNIAFTSHYHLTILEEVVRLREKSNLDPTARSHLIKSLRTLDSIRDYEKVIAEGIGLIIFEYGALSAGLIEDDIAARAIEHFVALFRQQGPIVDRWQAAGAFGRGVIIAYFPTLLTCKRLSHPIPFTCDRVNDNLDLIPSEEAAIYVLPAILCAIMRARDTFGTVLPMTLFDQIDWQIVIA